MKKHTLLILLISFLGSACYGEKSQSSIVVGEWLLKGAVGQLPPAECPDLLVLRKDGSYSVLNDCYGVDMRNPVTEVGEWIFGNGNNELSFESRKFEGNYFFGSESSDPLIAKVIRVSEDEMILQFNSSGPEIYHKATR